MYLFLLLLAGLQAGLPNQGLDVLHYGFSLQLTDASDRINGDALVRFKARRAAKEVTFDLVGVHGAEQKGMLVSKVTQGAHQLDFTHQGDLVIVHFKQALVSEHVYEIHIHYGGIPADGLIISQNRYGERTFFADNWPDRAHHWLPCVDHPSDKATNSFVVEAPSQYKVVANGTLVSETQTAGGSKRTEWVTKVAIPTKVMVVGVAQFSVQQLQESRGVPISSWVFPQDAERGFRSFAVAVPVVAWLTDYIGPFPYAKLANVQSCTRFGGMENAGAIFYYEQVFESEADGLVAHEVAHQWFGDSVSEADWPHIWLSEGFATYFSWRYLAAIKGPQAMQQSLQKARERILAFAEAHPGATVVRTEADRLNYLGAYSYQKAGYMLHMLQQRIGETAFQESIRTYYRRYRDSNAESSSFQTVVQEVSGENLERFFGQWLRQPGQPGLTVTCNYQASDKTLNVTVDQDPQHLYELHLPLLVEGVGAHMLKITQQSQTFQLPSPTAGPVTVNPGGALLLERLTVIEK